MPANKKDKNKHKTSKVSSADAVIAARKLLRSSAILCFLAVVMFVSAIVITIRRPAQIVYNPAIPYPRERAVESGSAIVTLGSVTYTDGQPPFQAPEGFQYVVINMKVKNNSAQPIQIIPTTDTYLKDSQGQVVTMAVFSVEHPFRAGELASGDTLQGELAYLIKRDTAYKFYIDALWSGTVLPFSLL